VRLRIKPYLWGDCPRGRAAGRVDPAARRPLEPP
jgi:hypothetical protein